MKVGPFEVSGSYVGDCRDLLRELPDGCVQTCVTSPPYYGLRDYGVDGQIGLEATPKAYVDEMVKVFEEVRRVLRDDGTLWLNLGDSYAGSRSGPQGESGEMAGRAVVDHRGMLSKTKGFDPKSGVPGFNDAPHRQRLPGLKRKDLIGIPWMVAFALRDAGWWLRMDIVWHKPNPMPESVVDRPTKSHEYVFLLAKSESYFYDKDAISEIASHGDHPRNGVAARADDQSPGNKRSVWTVATQSYAEAHFATFPPKLIEPCILAGSRPGDLVLDPFFGSGTTGKVAEDNGRLWLGFDLNPAYHELQKKRTAQQGLCFAPITKEG
jgi:DNA modification methylase